MEHDPKLCLRCKVMAVITDHYRGNTMDNNDALELLAVLSSICGEALVGANTAMITSFFNSVVYHQNNMTNRGMTQ